MAVIPGEAAAIAVARHWLGPLGERWEHTAGVGVRASQLAPTVPAEDRDLLIAAAWWHDLGYAPLLVVSGFHPLDGARYLAAAEYPERLCALVAYHSAAVFEAEVRGLSEQLAEWPSEDGPVADALWTADMTTGPQGQVVEYASRLAEILDRYDADSVVARAMIRSQPTIEAAIKRTKARLAA